MSRILIPDAGPLFSLAAADILDVLLHFPVAITDVVKQESIDKGAAPNASIEARRLLAFYSAHANLVEVVQTQYGQLLAAAKKSNPSLDAANSGELSIQSFLIELRNAPAQTEVAVLFEDSWFIRNAIGLPQNCELVSTSAFLLILERLRLIPSAEAAKAAIKMLRPHYYPREKIIPAGPDR
ncbi:MAG: hypothetical protein ACYCZQ_02990 [Burkholderiales bacterium]